MANHLGEQVIPLDVPADLVTKCNGFSLDFGGSVIKAIYRTKADFQNAQNQTMGRMNLVSFARARVDQAASFLKQNAHISPGGEGGEPTKVYITGVGGHQYQDKFHQELGVSLDVISEMDCFVHAFKYLSSKLPRNQLMYKLDMADFDEPIEENVDMMNAMEKTEDQSNIKVGIDQNFGDSLRGQMMNEKAWSSTRPLSEEDIFPCVLAIMGSGVGFMKVHKDGSSSYIDGGPRGGRAMYGLGSLLTGCKTFEELVDLASEGNAKNLHTTLKDLAEGVQGGAKDDDSNLYSSFFESKSSPVVFFFGKGVTSDIGDFKREDLAMAALNYFTHDFANIAHVSALMEDCKHIFFCGSIINNPLVRSLLTTEMVRRTIVYFIMSRKKTCSIPFDFLIPGPHLGAIGALLNTLEEFVHTHKEPQGAIDQAEGSKNEGEGANNESKE